MDEKIHENLIENKDDESIVDELSYDMTDDTVAPIETEEEQKQKSMAKEIYEWVSSVAFAVILAFLINTFVFSLVQVDGGSMLPTLHHGERLIVRKLLYTPNTEDVVIVKSQPLKKFIVKRVIALPNQELSFDNDMNVTVNGVRIEEDYINELQIEKGHLYNYPVTVPKKGEPAELEIILAEQALNPDRVVLEQKDGKLFISGSSFVSDGEFTEGKTKYTQDGYFVLGDNRNNSSDSRVFGVVPKNEIIGEAVIRFYPFNVMGIIK